MRRDQAIQETVDFVKRTLAQAEGAHDWGHVYRVWRLAQSIDIN